MEQAGARYSLSLQCLLYCREPETEVISYIRPDHEVELKNWLQKGKTSTSDFETKRKAQYIGKSISP